MQIISLFTLPSLLLMIFLHFQLTTVAGSFISIFPNTSFAESTNIMKLGCPTKCGDLTVPYPFGINSSCSINPAFAVHCDESFVPPKAFIGSDKLEVLGIFDDKIRVKNQLAWNCYDRFGNMRIHKGFSMDLSSSPLSISTENKFTVVGCDDAGMVTRNSTHDDIWGDDYNDEYVSSCVGVCSKPEDLSDGFCAGIGCCQASIPKGLSSIYSTMTTFNQHRFDYNFSSCGYSFLAEQNSYTFKVSDVSDSSIISRVEETVPLVLDWAIGYQTCDQARNRSEIICQGHSVCVDSHTGLGGYRCKCSQGYEGNPYLSPGCYPTATYPLHLTSAYAYKKCDRCDSLRR